MAVGRLSSEADLRRWLAGEFAAIRNPPLYALAPLATDPDPPTEGCLLYCIADNGAGKSAIRAIFPTGAPVAVATEP